MTALALLAVLLVPRSAAAAAPKAAAKAARPAARLQYASGPVTVETKDGKHDGKTAEPLADGDAVATGAGATAVVWLADGSRLKLRESSRLVLTLPGKKAPGTDILLTMGSVFASVTKRRAGAEFRMHSPTAVAAVRGTEFFTAYGRVRAGSRDLWVCVNKGAVDITTDKVKKPVTCPQGKGVMIKSGLDPDMPREFAWTKKLNWNMDPKAGDTRDATRMDGDPAYGDDEH